MNAEEPQFQETNRKHAIIVTHPQNCHTDSRFPSLKQSEGEVHLAIPRTTARSP